MSEVDIADFYAGSLAIFFHFFFENWEKINFNENVFLESSEKRMKLFRHIQAF